MDRLHPTRTTTTASTSRTANAKLNAKGIANLNLNGKAKSTTKSPTKPQATSKAMQAPGSPFDPTILRKHASLPSPSTSLPPTLYLSHTPHTLTLIDPFPKSHIHLLLLPRILPSTPYALSSKLTSLRALMSAEREVARGCLEGMRRDAGEVRGVVEEEMRGRFGCVWDVWVGFHAVQSLEHLHLHIISADLVMPGLKTKKHYNSFHPKLGFFLHLDDVLSWFEAAPSFFDTIKFLPRPTYTPKLTEPLECFRCAREFRNMPLLKAHLQEEFERVVREGRRREERRKRGLEKTGLRGVGMNGGNDKGGKEVGVGNGKREREEEENEGESVSKRVEVEVEKEEGDGEDEVQIVS